MGTDHYGISARISGDKTPRYRQRRYATKNDRSFKMKKSIMLGLAFMAMPFAANADYVIDTKGAHASVNFKVSHLGYSFIQGRFNTFSGDFSFDESNVKLQK